MKQVRIIKLLEQFCSNGDANAFYWFKNPKQTLKILLQQPQMQAIPLKKASDEKSESG